MRIEIDLNKIAREMVKNGFSKKSIEAGNLTGWGDTILDVLESNYGIESELSAIICDGEGVKS